MFKISVVVPIYNSTDTLSNCIESILNQSFSDLEVILVDDGSTDGSSEICDQFAKKDHRIKVIHQSNKGRTEARKVGVSQATGEWLCFVDSDDTLPIDSILVLQSATDNTTDIVLGNGYTLPNEQRKQIPMAEFRHLAVRAEGNIGLPWGSLYRRSVLTPYLFDLPRHIMMGEDYIFWLRLAFSTNKPVNVVYESVYHKGDEHTCNTFKWTSAYCYELNELRKGAISKEQHDEYLEDMLHDRIVNLFAVAIHEPQHIWRHSPYYQDIKEDMHRLNTQFSFKQRLFLLMPHIKTSFSWILFLLLAVLAMLGLQLFDAPTLSDDIIYHFIWQEDESSIPQQIESLGDLITSQWIHYHVVNGRWVVHSIAQAFLAFTHPVVYHIINAVLFSLMLYLGSCLIVGREYRLFSMMTICFLLFVVIADVKTTLLWSMGTFNYLWVCVATLAFLLYLRHIAYTNSHIHWFLSPFALLIGCSHEAISLPLSITLVVYTFFELRKDRLYPRTLYIIWYVIGTLICLLSPGIWGRADGDISLMSRLMSGAINIVFNMKVAWLLIIALLVIYRGQVIKALWLRRYHYLCLLLALGIVAVCGTNLERVVFYVDFIAMLLLVQLLTEKMSLCWQKRLMAVFSLIMLIYYVPAMMVRYENHENYCFMEQQMKQEGREVIAVRQPITGESTLLDFFRRRFVNPTAEFGFYCCYMGFNANDINMRQAAVLYGKSHLSFLPEDVLQRIENDSNAYQNYELDSNGQLYVWQLQEDKPVHQIIFHLKPEDFASLNVFQRMVAYKEDTYELDDNFHYSVVHVGGRPYLIFTRPTTNIYRRIQSISFL